VLHHQPQFQVPVSPGQLIIAPQRVTEGDLLRPPWMTGANHVQVRDPPLPGRIWLDEEPPPRPPIQLRRHVTPALPGEPLHRLADNDIGIAHRSHQVNDRFGGKPGNRRRPDMLNPVSQPRCQQPGQSATLGLRTLAQPGIMRTDLCLLISPRRDGIIHTARLARSH
jgi:hypothetical protein